MKVLNMAKGRMAAFLILAVLSTATPAVLAADAPKDVPAGHVALESVKLLIGKGYLPLYDDGSFKGTNSVDRYTLALVVAKLLKDIDAGKVKMTDEDLRLVQRLSTEFREELVAQGLQVDRLRADIGSIKGDLAAKETLSTKAEAQQNAEALAQSKRLAQAQDSINALNAKLMALEASTTKGLTNLDQVKALEAKVQTLEQQLTAVRAKSEADLSYMKTIAVIGTLGGVLLSILVGTQVR